MKALEEGAELQIDFAKLEKAVASSPGVIPVAIQDVDSNELILVAYTNREAFEKSVKDRMLILWSTSRNELWEKGKTSGETFELLEVRVNCEQNSLLYIVRPNRGKICHTKNENEQARNCYYRKLNFETGELENTDP